jgi:predicted RNA-binding protein with PUA-like domain
MKSWIFQARPDQYDIRSRLRVGMEVPWYATRFASEMREGDAVIFWLAGPPSIRGIYARGHVSGTVYKDSEGAPRIPVRIDEILKKHISVEQIRKNPELKDLSILRIPIGTNFKLEHSQFEAISNLFGS